MPSAWPGEHIDLSPAARGARESERRADQRARSNGRRSWLALIVAVAAVVVPIAQSAHDAPAPSCAQTLTALSRVGRRGGSPVVPTARVRALTARLMRELDTCR